jgi:S-formylglutathione hydrolase FrmB
MSGRASDRHRGAIRRRRLTALGVLLLALAGLAAFLAPRLLGPDTHGALVVHLTVKSAAVHADEPLTVVVPGGPPPARARRPLLVFLHGHDANQDSYLDSPMFAALARLGRAAPVIAFPYGGADSYWHDRAGGAWARYVTNEVIPFVERRFHTDPRRIAVGGISMGGFGALDLAMHQPGRFCAVGAHSPAIWRSGGETAAGAFDDAQDFAANDLVADARAHPGDFAARPLRIDAGDADPFLPGDRALVAALRAGGVPAELHTAPGGHTHAYWTSHWKDYLPFYAAALRRCRS